MFSITHMTVADFNQWKSAFDSMNDARTNAGVVSTKAMQDAQNPNDVFVILEWPEISKAKDFFASSEFKEAVQKGGAQGEPEIKFFNEV